MDDIKESLDDILFNLAYQEGKSVQECLYDVYIKGKRDGISEYHSALMKAFVQTDLKSRGIHFDNVINMVFTEIKEDI